MTTPPKYADAPIVCATAEIVANLALAAGGASDIGTLVADEFHFYGDPDRGWAWQVPLLELPKAQFLLMSATLGDTAWLEKDLTSRTGRQTTYVGESERPDTSRMTIVCEAPEHAAHRIHKLEDCCWGRRRIERLRREFRQPAKIPHALCIHRFVSISK